MLQVDTLRTRRFFGRCSYKWAPNGFIDFAVILVSIHRSNEGCGSRKGYTTLDGNVAVMLAAGSPDNHHAVTTNGRAMIVDGLNIRYSSDLL